MADLDLIRQSAIYQKAPDLVRTTIDRALEQGMAVEPLPEHFTLAQLWTLTRQTLERGEQAQRAIVGRPTVPVAKAFEETPGAGVWVGGPQGSKDGGPKTPQTLLDPVCQASFLPSEESAGIVRDPNTGHCFIAAPDGRPTGSSFDRLIIVDDGKGEGAGKWLAVGKVNGGAYLVTPDGHPLPPGWADIKVFPDNTAVGISDHGSQYLLGADGLPYGDAYDEIRVLENGVRIGIIAGREYRIDAEGKGQPI